MGKQKGLVIVFTGDGKGKTSAALGIALRASGYGMRTFMLKFIKGPVRSGEDEALRKNRCIKMMSAGEGFYKILNDKLPPEIHKKAAREGLRTAARVIRSGKFDIVILDEINVALALGLISFSEVRRLIKGRPPTVHLVLTGRYAKKALIRLADLVTEMKEIKHPFTKNMPAVKGIDY